MSDDLESLLVDGKELNKKLVVEILSPYLKIDRNTREIIPISLWSELKTNTKILLYLMARKAMIALGLSLPEEAASSTEIIQNTGMKKGTVNPALRVLFGDGIVAQTNSQKYYVPNHAIERVKAMVSPH